MLTLKRPKIGRSIVALDLGDTGMRSVQLRQGGRQWAISSVGQCNDTEHEKRPDERTEIWRRWMELCFDRARFTGRRVGLAVSPPDLHYVSLEIPEAILNQPAETAKSVLHEEIRRMLPVEQHDVFTAHWRLPDPSVSAPNILGVATEQMIVKQALAACRLAGLDCLTIDAAATSLCRFGSVLSNFNDKQIWGVLDLGHRQTRLILCIGDMPILTRAVGVGSMEMTNLIAEELGTTFETAEVQKCRHGISVIQKGPQGDRRDNEKTDRRGMRQSENPFGHDSSDAFSSDNAVHTLTPSMGKGADGTEVGSILFGILRASLTTLAAEINRSYEYALSCYGQLQACDLILVGGGASLMNLPEFLSESLGIPVRRAHAYLGEKDCRLTCEFDGNQQVDRYAVAIGLPIQD